MGTKIAEFEILDLIVFCGRLQVSRVDQSFISLRVLTWVNLELRQPGVATLCVSLKLLYSLLSRSTEAH